MDRAALRVALQEDILRLEGFKSSAGITLDVGLSQLNNAFPNKTFPIGAVHEFISSRPEDDTATSGFIAGILSSVMGLQGVTVWISASRNIFAPALKHFGIEPHRIIFVDLNKEQHISWAMEEALKCGSLSAVVGELKELTFTTSRRLQLAVENSRVTGFVLRKNCKKITTTACVSRWRISSRPGIPIEDLPGVGFPCWKAELLKIKNGKPGAWDIAWMDGRFVAILPNHLSDLPKVPLEKTG